MILLPPDFAPTIYRGRWKKEGTYENSVSILELFIFKE
jgi:hypothetical protein